MDASEALKIIETLADGVDPVTGEVFPDNSPYQKPSVIRALFYAARALESEVQRSKRQASLPSNAGASWSESEDIQLVQAFERGDNEAELARSHQRTRGAIHARLIRLGNIQE